MSKELDKVNEIYHTRTIYKADGTTVIESGLFNLLVAYAKEALQRLESIDNAKPSEAMECLDNLGNSLSLANELLKVTDTSAMDKYITTIKQALLKAQKEHNSVNLLMQELDCKDFAELRKYARCGYEKINKK